MAPGGERIARIYTRTGDAGETGLAHGGRIAKDSLRVAASGDLDELGAHLGLARSTLSDPSSELAKLLLRLQHELYVAQSEVSTPADAPAPKHLLGEQHIRRLEEEIDRYADTFEPVHTFVLPGGKAAGSQLHVARTVARRAERELWALHRREPLRRELLIWANRLSDLLFALALSANRSEGFVETPPDYAV
ncbi:MAG: cob(I)yrinic acid a,c-diamide adenosyltransferase [Thermoplasmata archaeon]|nr:cob(I)yrinic acid a,c-diamide adenosyltransferase [Thermoplasmata archaeon]